MNKNITPYILALHRMEFLRTAEKLALFELVDPLESVFSISRADMETLIGRRLKTDRFRPEEYLSSGFSDIKVLERSKIGVVFYWDTEYPPQLREIYDPPFLLFYRGMLPSFNLPAVGIVGTRFPTGNARGAAFELGMQLSDAGIDVVSGLARGIDREAHMGCLASLGSLAGCLAGSLDRKGRPIAVLGNGIDTVYPSSSRKTAEQIYEQGGVIFSEYPPGILPLKYHFPARNRIISGLSRGVAVVQAPEKSGALITAEYALEQGRDLYVHAAGLVDEQGKGTLMLSTEGAQVIRNGNEILADWGMPVDSSGRNCDYIIDGNENHIGKDLAKMLEAELAGKVQLHNGKYY